MINPTDPKSGGYSQLTVKPRVADANEWRIRLARWLEAVEEETDLEFVSTNFREDPSVLASERVQARFEGCTFHVFSTEIGEIYFTHGDLGVERVVRVFKILAESLAAR